MFFVEFVKDKIAGKVQNQGGDAVCNHIGENKWKKNERTSKRREASCHVLSFGTVCLVFIALI